MSTKYNIAGGLLPYGGSGLKYFVALGIHKRLRSPSVWREWIEIRPQLDVPGFMESPSVWREWIEIERREG